MPDRSRNAQERYWYTQGKAHGSMYPSIGELKWLWLVIAVVIVGAFLLRMFALSGDAGSLDGDPASSDGEVAPAYGPGRIAFYSERDGDREIYVINADGSGVVQLTDNDSDERDPEWSPDGNRIMFVSDRDNDVEMYDIYVMNADGSGVEQLTDGCSNRSPAWSPDGDRIAFDSRADIYVMNADGSGVVQLTGTLPESCGEVFFSDRRGAGFNELYIRNADGSVELFTEYDSLDFASVDWFSSWSPDGGRIAFQSGRDGDAEIYVMNADGSSVEQLTENEYYDWFPSWSPDGGRIAFESDRDSGDDYEIFVMNLDGSGLVQLTENDSDDRGPAWSPDGGRIAFSSDRDGDMGIYVMNADGSGVARLGEGYSPAWSPLMD